MSPSVHILWHDIIEQFHFDAPSRLVADGDVEKDDWSSVRTGARDRGPHLLGTGHGCHAPRRNAKHACNHVCARRYASAIKPLSDHEWSS